MSVVSLERRLRKVEAATRPPKGVFFMVWGEDQADCEAQVAAALDARTIEIGDVAVYGTWPWPNDRPTTRWVYDGAFSFPWHEYGRITEMLIKVRARELAAQGFKVGNLPDDDWPQPEGRPKYLNQVSDEKLIAYALGQRIGTAAAHDKDRDQWFTNFLEISGRAVIRGSLRVLKRVKAGEPAPIRGGI